MDTLLIALATALLIVAIVYWREPLWNLWNNIDPATRLQMAHEAAAFFVAEAEKLFDTHGTGVQKKAWVQNQLTTRFSGLSPMLIDLMIELAVVALHRTGLRSPDA